MTNRTEDNMSQPNTSPSNSLQKRASQIQIALIERWSILNLGEETGILRDELIDQIQAMPWLVQEAVRLTQHRQKIDPKLSADIDGLLETCLIWSYTRHIWDDLLEADGRDWVSRVYHITRKRLGLDREHIRGALETYVFDSFENMKDNAKNQESAVLSPGYFRTDKNPFEVWNAHHAALDRLRKNAGRSVRKNHASIDDDQLPPSTRRELHEGAQTIDDILEQKLARWVYRMGYLFSLHATHHGNGNLEEGLLDLITIPDKSGQTRADNQLRSASNMDWYMRAALVYGLGERMKRWAEQQTNTQAFLNPTNLYVASDAADLDSQRHRVQSLTHAALPELEALYELILRRCLKQGLSELRDAAWDPIHTQALEQIFLNFFQYYNRRQKRSKSSLPEYQVSARALGRQAHGCWPTGGGPGGGQSLPVPGVDSSSSATSSEGQHGGEEFSLEREASVLSLVGQAIQYGEHILYPEEDARADRVLSLVQHAIDHGENVLTEDEGSDAPELEEPTPLPPPVELRRPQWSGYALTGALSLAAGVLLAVGLMQEGTPPPKGSVVIRAALLEVDGDGAVRPLNRDRVSLGTQIGVSYRVADEEGRQLWVWSQGPDGTLRERGPAFAYSFTVQRPKLLILDTPGTYTIYLHAQEDWDGQDCPERKCFALTVQAEE